MITPQELTLKEQSKNLSPEEASAMNQLEAYIDKKIKASFTRGQASVCDFWYDRQEVPSFYELKHVRKEIVREILFDKYRENGWSIKLEVGEDDGPNRPGLDFWIFTQK